MRSSPTAMKSSPSSPQLEKAHRTQQQRPRATKISQLLTKILVLYTSLIRASPMDKWVKNLLAMQETQETQIPSLCGEDLLKKEMATHSSILA